MQILQESICVGIFFNKVADPQKCNLIKKWLQHRCFPVKFVKFLRIPFLQNISSQWLFLTVSGFQPATLLKKRLWQRCFLVNFANFIRISFDRIPADTAEYYSCVYRWILGSFSKHLFYWAPLGKCLFHV